ncbi:hypothetical protein [Alkalihalobacterium alkalinitrilicum]|nr:hypothetical protein [Alkalihalobacterium alkalinitrilicum]
MPIEQQLNELVSYFESELQRQVLEREIEFLQWLQEKIDNSKCK